MDLRFKTVFLTGLSIKAQPHETALFLTNNGNIAIKSAIRLITRRPVPGFILMITFFLVLSASPLSGYKEKVPSLVELTRSASVIVSATIRNINNGSIVVAVNKVIKGQDIPHDMSLIWDNVSNIEHKAPQYHLGEALIIFAAKKDDIQFEPLFGSFGVISEVQASKMLLTLGDYEHTVEQLIRDSATRTPQGRIDLLTAMLDDNAFSKQAALEIIYLEIRPEQYPIKELVQPLLALSRMEKSSLAVPAVQALGAISDKTLVPEFIELLNSDNFYIRQTAIGIVRDKTGIDLKYDPSEPKSERTVDIQNWKEWWKMNGTKTSPDR
jgi:hypothetical protein